MGSERQNRRWAWFRPLAAIAVGTAALAYEGHSYKPQYENLPNVAASSIGFHIKNIYYNHISDPLAIAHELQVAQLFEQGFETP